MNLYDKYARKLWKHLNKRFGMYTPPIIVKN